jgi:hypothetical protein
VPEIGSQAALHLSDERVSFLFGVSLFELEEQPPTLVGWLARLYRNFYDGDRDGPWNVGEFNHLAFRMVREDFIIIIDRLYYIYLIGLLFEMCSLELIVLL